MSKIDAKKFVTDMIYGNLDSEGLSGVQLTTLIGKLEHTGNYTVLPESIRRCRFINSSEKDVLWELISWSKDGYVNVLQDIISDNVGLSISCVKSSLKTLKTKKFISVGNGSKRKNYYKIPNLAINPYVLLSKYIHLSRKYWINRINSPEFAFETGYSRSLDLKPMKMAIDDFINKQIYHEPFINQLSELVTSEADASELYSSITNEVWSQIAELYQKKVDLITAKEYSKASYKAALVHKGA